MTEPMVIKDASLYASMPMTNWCFRSLPVSPSGAGAVYLGALSVGTPTNCSKSAREVGLTTNSNYNTTTILCGGSIC